MPYQLFTFKGKQTGKVYQTTGYSKSQAAKKIGISIKQLIFEKAEPTNWVPPTPPPQGWPK